MIVSHKYRFIFLKTGKVGGTSLEIALSKYLGPDDVVTPVSLADDEKRHSLGFVTPQNFWKAPSEMGAGDLLESLRRGAQRRMARPGNRWRQDRKLPRKYRNHISAAALRPLLGEEVWNGYYKFTVDRNPWDKTVSMFFWDQKGDKKDLTFSEFVTSGRSYDSNFETYAVNGIPQVDRIVRYEALAEDLGEVSEAVGLPENVHDVMRTLSAKQGFRKTRDYRELYDERLRDIVAVQYAREIALLGYEF